MYEKVAGGTDGFEAGALRRDVMEYPMCSAVRRETRDAEEWRAEQARAYAAVRSVCRVRKAVIARRREVFCAADGELGRLLAGAELEKEREKLRIKYAGQVGAVTRALIVYEKLCFFSFSDVDNSSTRSHLLSRALCYGAIAWALRFLCCW
jgi:hypothetical protein